MDYYYTDNQIEKCLGDMILEYGISGDINSLDTKEDLLRQKIKVVMNAASKDLDVVYEEESLEFRIVQVIINKIDKYIK